MADEQVSPSGEEKLAALERQFGLGSSASPPPATPVAESPQSGEEKLAALERQFGLAAAPAAKPSPPDFSTLGGGVPGEPPAPAPPPTPEKMAPGPETATVEIPRSDGLGGGKGVASPPEPSGPSMLSKDEGTGERGFLNELGASAVRGVGGIMKMPRAIMNVFGVHTGEGLAESGEELEKEYAASPSVSKGITESPSVLTNPKWWASTLPSLAVQLIPIAIAALGGEVAAPALGVGAAAGEAIGGMAAGGLIGVSDAGERMLAWEKEHGQELPTTEKILIGLGSGVAGTFLPGMTLTKLVGKEGEKILASKVIREIFKGKTGQAIADRAVRAAYGGGAMAGFSVIENAFEKYGYNPDRQLTQGILESLITGTAISGIHGEIGLQRARYEKAKKLNEFFGSLSLDKDRSFGSEAWKEDLLGQLRAALDDATTKINDRRGQPREEAPKVIGEEPAPQQILDAQGKPAVEAKVRAALQKQPFERNAEEKLLADQAEKQGIDIREYAGPRPMATAGTAAIEVSKAPKPTKAEVPSEKKAAPEKKAETPLLDRINEAPPPDEPPSSAPSLAGGGGTVGIASTPAETGKDFKDWIQEKSPEKKLLGGIQDYLSRPGNNLIFDNKVFDDPTRFRLNKQKELQVKVGNRWRTVDADTLAQWQEKVGMKAAEPTTPQTPPAPMGAPGVTSEDVGKTEPEEKPATGRDSFKEAAALGNKGVAKTADGTKVPYQWGVVELDDIVASHDHVNLEENPKYPQELQPRDREAAPNELELANLQNIFDTDYPFVQTPSSSSGAPILGPDMLMESGNGRTIIFRRFQTGGDPRWPEYRQKLLDKAEEYGIDPEAIKDMKDPTLVRIRTNKISDAERRELVKKMNVSEVGKMGDVEYAKLDARALMEGDILDLFRPEYGLETGENKDFRSAFLGRIVGPKEAKEYLTNEGGTNDKGYARIRRALFALAYQSPDALERLASKTDDPAKNITDALLRVAPRVAKIDREIGKGNLYPLSISQNMAEAARIQVWIKENIANVPAGMDPYEFYLKQKGLFEQPAPETLDILALYQKYKGAPKKLADIFDEYLKTVEKAGNPRQPDMFGATAVPDKRVALEAAVKLIDEAKYGQEKGPLGFQGAKAAPEPRAEGPGGTASEDTTGPGGEEGPQGQGPALKPTKFSVQKGGGEEGGLPPGTGENVPEWFTPQSPQQVKRSEARLEEIQSKFKGLEPDRVRQVLYALPHEPDPVIAAMAADPELFNKVQQANIRLEMQKKEAAAKKDKGQASLFGDEPPPGRLFNVQKSVAKEFAPIFYSMTRKSLEAKLPGKGNGEQLASLIEGWMKKGDPKHPIKAEELKWSGLLPWLREQQGTVTKQQVVDFLEENQVELTEVVRQIPNYEIETGKYAHDAPTKFEEWMKLPPGAINYTERLLTLPDRRKDALWKKAQEAANFLGIPVDKVSITKLKEAKAPEDLIDGFSKWMFPAGGKYWGPEFRVPGAHAYGEEAADVNRFAHVFTFDLTIGGKKTLVLWELQNDWNMARRKQAAKLAKAEGLEKGTPEFNKRVNELAVGDAILRDPTDGSQVPPLAFFKNWHEVALKKMIRHAAENGYDAVAWATGDIVKDRYALSQHIDAIRYLPAESPGYYEVEILKDGRLIDEETFDAQELEERFGKEIAERIVNGEGVAEAPDGSIYEGGWPEAVVEKNGQFYIRYDNGKEWGVYASRSDAERDMWREQDALSEEPPVIKALRGLDLQVGAEWANRFYDETIPNFLKKYGKQWGARAEDKEFDIPEPLPQNIGAANEKGTLHTLNITPAMQDAVLYQGQPLYRTGQGEPALGLGVSTKKIQKRLGKNGTVRELDVAQDENYLRAWEITTKGGLSATILESKDRSLHLSLGTELNAEYDALGIAFQPGDILAGAHRALRFGNTIKFGSVIELAKGQGPRVLDHEIWHLVEFWLLNEKERAKIAKKYGENEESRANAYMAWEPKKDPDTIFQKILDFFKTLLKAVSGYESAEDIFAKVRSGEIFERAPRVPEELAPAKFSVQRGETPPEDALLGVRRLEDSAETRQEWTPETPMTHKRFAKELLKDNEALKTRLTSPGNQEIPLYVGEKFTDRAGNQIVDKKGRVRFLNDQEIWERFYKPQAQRYSDLGGTQAPDPLRPPEGTVEPPPNKKPGWLEPVRRSLKEKISVNTISNMAKYAHQSLVEHMGWAAREMDKTAKVLDKYLPLFDKMDQDALNRFTDIAEDGEKNLEEAVRNGELSPEHLEAAQAWRRLSDGFHFLIAHQKGDQFAYWKEYFPRMAKNPEMAQEIIANYLASHGRRGGGAASFLEARKILKTSTLFKPKLLVRESADGGFEVVKRDLYENKDSVVQTFDNRADAETMVKEKGGLGLEPLDTNYVTMMKANLWEKARWLMDNYIKNDLTETGFMGTKKMPGWVPVADKGIWRGNWAHPDLAAVIEKHLSPGMRNDPLFKLYYEPFSFMNEAFVGFSAFHASFSTLSFFSHGIGMNLPRAIGAALRGDFKTMNFHLGQLAKTANLPGSLMEAGKYIQQWKNPQAHPELEFMVDLLQRGGTRVKTDAFSKVGQSFADAWAENKMGLPRQIIKAMAWPIMNWLVPRFKIIAEVRRLEAEIFKAKQEGRILSREDLTGLAQQVTREGDNIFGQMIYDNLGMKRGFKDLLGLYVGFPGWNLGSLKIIKDAGMGAVHLVSEPARYLAEALTGGKPKWQAMTREQRMGLEFMVGMTLTMAVGSAIIQRLLAGEWPKDAKDLFMPRTGSLLPNGEPERMRLPTYMRDVLSLNHPVSMIQHKMAFPFRLASELVNNQDYFGTQIRDPWADKGEQAGQVLDFVGKSLLPFGVQGMMNTEDPRARWLNVAGLTKVPREYTNTPALQIIDEYNQLTRATTTTKETAAMKEAKANLTKLARAGDEDGFQDAAEKAVDEGKLTRQQVKEIVKESQQPPGVSRFTKLPLEWALRVWDAASDYEKERWKPYFLKKIMGEKPETLIKHREETAGALEGMGLKDAADTVRDLTMPKESTQFDLSNLGQLMQNPELADTDVLDLALTGAIEKKLAPKQSKTSIPRVRVSTKEKKKPYGVLGL